MVPRNKPAVNAVELAETASREYIESSDRVISLVDRLGDAHAKLSQLRRQRDELLLSAVTSWHELDAEDQTRLRVLLRVVRQVAAEKLLDSIVQQQPSPRVAVPVKPTIANQQNDQAKGG
jgi:hypothetical protein